MHYNSHKSGQLPDDMSDSNLTRRELMARLGKAGLAAPFAWSRVADLSQTLSPPRNLRLEASRPVITPADLRFLGFIRFPAAAGSLWNSYPSLAFRRVAGQWRVFIYDDWPAPKNSAVLEFALPDAAPDRQVANAPFCTLVRNWGDIRTGHAFTGTSTSETAQ